MPITKLRPSFTFDQDRLDELRAVVPEAFADGKINWDVLKEALGEHLEDEDAETEHFGLFWPGKREARRLAGRPSKGTLVPQPGLGVDEETTHNLFIEGDNLEVLKLLQKSYAGRVKMIYIDPPYNTGEDRIYLDCFSESVEAYLNRTGQADEASQLLTTNTRSDGRFHSNWLSMMYPRLRLARQLLHDDGAIFVNIDDNEVHNLRQLMNEVFGEENFVTTLIWQKMDSPSRNDENRPVSVYHDYILVFSRDRSRVGLMQKPKPQILDAYPLRLSDGRLARRRQLRKNGAGARRQDRPSMWYPLIAPDGTAVYPIAPEGWEGRWVLSQATWEERERAGLTEWIQREYGWVPYYIETAPENPSIPWPTLWTEVDQNRQAKAKFTALMGPRTDFDNPKPVNLIRDILRMSATENDICLDFFSGTSTTAHAVLSLNHEDNQTRRFIMVQLPEPTNHPDFPTIADIGRERIRRVIAHMKDETEGQLDLRPDQDLGFKSYRLDRSNFKEWQDYEGEDTDRLATLFDRFESPLVEDWQPGDLLTEILLTEGFPLDSRIELQDRFTHNQVHLVTADFHAHRLFICLDATIAPDTIAQLDLQDRDVFVCLDTALTDQTKIRLSDAGNIHVI